MKKNRAIILSLIVLLLITVTGSVAYGSEFPELPIGHGWGEWIVEKEPSCTEAGEWSCTCKNCGRVETTAIAALGHTLEVEETPATEESEGQRIIRCTRCDYKKVEILPIIKQPTPAPLPPAPDLEPLAPSETPEIQFPEEPQEAMVVAGITSETVEPPPVVEKPMIEMVAEPEKPAAPTPEPPKTVPKHSQTATALEPSEAVSNRFMANALDYLLGTACIGTVGIGIAMLAPYIHVFLWIKEKKRQAIQRIYGGR